MTTLSNQPPLSEQLTLAYEDPILAIREALDATSENIAVIDDATAALAVEHGKPLKALQGKVEKARKAEKDYFVRAGREVDAFFASMRLKLDEVFASIDQKINAYQTAKRQAALEAERKEREAAEVFGDKPAEAPKPADTVRVEAASGTKVSGTVKWDFEIVDVAALPRSLLMPNLPAIKARADGLKAMGVKLQDAKIPGIRLFEKVQSSWR